MFEHMLGSKGAVCSLSSSSLSLSSTANHPWLYWRFSLHPDLPHHRAAQEVWQKYTIKDKKNVSAPPWQGPQMITEPQFCFYLPIITKENKSPAIFSFSTAPTSWMLFFVQHFFKMGLHCSRKTSVHLCCTPQLWSTYTFTSGRWQQVSNTLESKGTALEPGIIHARIIVHMRIWLSLQTQEARPNNMTQSRCMLVKMLQLPNWKSFITLSAGSLGFFFKF